MDGCLAAEKRHLYFYRSWYLADMHMQLTP